MLRIKIEAQEANFVNRQIGQRTVREQSAYAYLNGERIPRLLKFNLPDNQATAYPVGDYTPALSNYQIGKYDSLVLNPWELELVPIKAESAK